MNNTHIKTADPQDTSLLTRLIRESFRDVAERFNLSAENCPKHPSNCVDDWIKNDFDSGVIYYILEHQGIPVACVGLEKADPDQYYLERLAVLPGLRKRGFGRTIVEHVFNQARNIGVKKISIGIIEKQRELKNWYQKMGFIEKATQEFAHLPFLVTFMSYTL
ncbi:MAG: GNAT family N-acetyltransferase [Deltaproteobacteria bacterium]|nr:GNAT family N-acetyltransferase [Deltaproteobacteria bacterium]